MSVLCITEDDPACRVEQPQVPGRVLATPRWGTTQPTDVPYQGLKTLCKDTLKSVLILIGDDGSMLGNEVEALTRWGVKEECSTQTEITDW